MDCRLLFLREVLIMVFGFSMLMLCLDNFKLYKNRILVAIIMATWFAIIFFTVGLDLTEAAVLLTSIFIFYLIAVLMFLDPYNSKEKERKQFIDFVNSLFMSLFIVFGILKFLIQGRL